jgi:predicted RND superfamily exporter protein
LPRPKPVFLFALLLTAALALPLRQLRFDNTPESWLPSDSPGMRALAVFRSQFGDGAILVAALEGDNLPQRPALWRQLQQQIAAVPGVSLVIAPPFAEVESAGPTPPMAAFLESEDRRHAAFVIVPQDGLPVSEKGSLVHRLETLLNHTPLGHFSLAGPAVITHDLDTGSRDSLLTLGPVVALVLCAVLYFTTREWRALAAVLLLIAVASVWSLGLLGLFGRPLNLVVVILPAILAVCAITQAMHTLSAYHHLPAGTAPREAWPIALRQVFKPSLFCALTTAAGFLSLATSSIAPVRDLGLFTAAGVLFCFALSFTLFPALLALSPRVVPHGVEAQSAWSPTRALALSRFITSRRRLILLLSTAVLLLSVYGITLIRVDSHILEFFPPSHRIPQNYRSIEKILLGLTPVDIVLSGPRDALLTDASLAAYRRFFAQILQDEPLARQVISVLIEPSRGRDLELVMTAAELREALDAGDFPPALQAFVRFDRDQITLRTTLLTTTASTKQVYDLIERLRLRLAAAPLSPGVSSAITGSTPLLIEGQVLLLKTQIQSFATALVIVALAILIAFRSIRAAIVILVPNLIPIASTLGFMGFAGIPLNTATVTVAGIALGLIVDDSIHYYHHFRNTLATASPAEANYQTLLQLARPITITSLAVASGFALFGLSPFLPTAYFGVLLALTAASALICVLLLLPALLETTHP